MLVANRVAQALEGMRAAFEQAAARVSESRDQYLQALDGLRRLSGTELRDQIGGVPWPGAYPTEEMDEKGCIVPFGTTWETAQVARAWALERLRGVSTAAVDGSQIAASKEFDVSVALVQVGWFINHHDPARAYTKDLRNRLLSPDDPPGEVAEYAFAESRLNRCRYAMEIEAVIECVDSLADTEAPVVFHDGSFVLSFAGRMPEEGRKAYLSALFGLLDVSRERRVPVVGYVDRSLAGDLMTMLRHAFDLPRGSLSDAQLLASRMEVFDRTAAFQCARQDIMPEYRQGERDYSQDVCFVYLKTGQDRLPSRIDFPRWVLDAGLLDRVMDVIRAEIVVGSGYPYALETADATAVLTLEDRLAFYRQWQEFAATAGIETFMPGKTTSKGRRR